MASTITNKGFGVDTIVAATSGKIEWTEKVQPPPRIKLNRHERRKMAAMKGKR